MKPTHKILLGLAAASAWLIAGSVTIPNSFTANTTAKASEVNANFSAVKTAVDGNAHDIATNKSNIAGAITGVTTAGGLTGGGNSGSVTVRRANGKVSVPPAAFVAGNDNGCYLNKEMTYYLFFDETSTTNDQCVALAPVSLPDTAKLEKLTCYFYNYDTNTSTNPKVQLKRAELSSSLTLAEDLFEVESGGDAQETRPESDNSIDDASHATVDNGEYTYTLYYDPPNHTKTIGNRQSFNGCSIEYSFQ